jgi:phosphoglucomutase
MEKEAIDKNVAITYTPLNGTGLKCVTRCLQENGFTKIIVPTEQEQPDGNFLTCPYPNPEIREALSVGLEWAKRTNSDLLLASDPDCDRIGVAVKNGDDYTLLTGNQIGVLLLEYICKRRIAYGTMPEHPIVIKTIVTTDMAEKIAKKYGVKIINVLTGFKFIGEQIGYLEASGEVNRYIFGFEESYGYLSGSFVRDKDGVNAALLICEMFAYYKSLGKSLLDVLNELFTTFGVFKETLQSFSFEGPEGSEKIQRIMTNLRDNPPKIILGKRLWAISDYKKSQTIFDDGHIEKIQLPMSDVLKFNLADDISIVIRPSGTEPKLKSYYSVKAETWEESVRWTEEFQAYFANYIYSFGGNP